MAEQALYHEFTKTNYLSGRADYLSVNFPLLVADSALSMLKWGMAFLPHRSGPSCATCRNSLARRYRSGFFERRILSLIGIYPWECLNCGATAYLHWKQTQHPERPPA
jgi:hypothetical protein